MFHIIDKNQLEPALTDNFSFKIVVEFDKYFLKRPRRLANLSYPSSVVLCALADTKKFNNNNSAKA